ncbi:MAG: nucleotide exchange factor GrpE, partial [Desulfosarcina sp.]|nr:nucleotide exchange factor GrpE [Desulfosarcina sp.]
MAQKKKIVIEDENHKTTHEPPSIPSNPDDADDELPFNADSPTDVEEKLAAAEAKASENHDRMLRMAAELDNYKKRAARELDDIKKYATENLIRQLLTVVDNLERAIASAASENESGQSLVDGVALTLA